jgi:hypothetical protein
MQMDKCDVCETGKYSVDADSSTCFFSNTPPDIAVPSPAPTRTRVPGRSVTLSALSDLLGNTAAASGPAIVTAAPNTTSAPSASPTAVQAPVHIPCCETCVCESALPFAATGAQVCDEVLLHTTKGDTSFGCIGLYKRARGSGPTEVYEFVHAFGSHPCGSGRGKHYLYYSEERSQWLVSEQVGQAPFQLASTRMPYIPGFISSSWLAPSADGTFHKTNKISGTCKTSVEGYSPRPRTNPTLKLLKKTEVPKAPPVTAVLSNATTRVINCFNYVAQLKLSRSEFEKRYKHEFCDVLRSAVALHRLKISLLSVVESDHRDRYSTQHGVVITFALLIPGDESFSGNDAKNLAFIQYMFTKLVMQHLDPTHIRYVDEGCPTTAPTPVPTASPSPAPTFAPAPAPAATTHQPTPTATKPSSPADAADAWAQWFKKKKETPGQQSSSSRSSSSKVHNARQRQRPQHGNANANGESGPSSSLTGAVVLVLAVCCGCLWLHARGRKTPPQQTDGIPLVEPALVRSYQHLSTEATEV